MRTTVEYVVSDQSVVNEGEVVAVAVINHFKQFFAETGLFAVF